MGMVKRAAREGMNPTRPACTKKENPSTMKILITALVAFSGLTFAAPKSEASDYCYTTTVSYCAPYRVSTCVVYRNSYCRTSYDRCGNAYHYTVTVVTYRDNYSDGSSRTYSRSFHG